MGHKLRRKERILRILSTIESRHSHHLTRLPGPDHDPPEDTGIFPATTTTTTVWSKTLFRTSRLCSFACVCKIYLGHWQHFPATTSLSYCSSKCLTWSPTCICRSLSTSRGLLGPSNAEARCNDWALQHKSFVKSAIIHNTHQIHENLSPHWNVLCVRQALVVTLLET